MKRILSNETYCVRHCCYDTPKRAVHAEGGAVSINTDIKSEDTKITDTRNHRSSTVCNESCRFMAEWVREEEKASKTRQKKREEEEADMVEVVPSAALGSLTRFRATLIGPTQELKHSVGYADKEA